MQKQEIIDKITNELIEEIKASEKNFSNEEIKEKINQKLIDYTLNNKENLLQKEKSKEEDLILKNEFTKIDDDNEEDNFDFTIENNFDENNTNDNIDNDTPKSIEDKKDKKFFQEVKDIYKNEFKQSISCFSNVVDSMKLTSKTSLFELILVFLFLVIPAILAGCIAFLIVILLFIIWQIYLITKTIYKLLEKAEFSIKDTINNIKIKIKNYKKSGGFINKLIFSNTLYTLLMFNGVMYMLIKGLMLPVKSVLDVEKILANIIAKIEKGITTALKAPSELAVANTKSQNFKKKEKSKNNKKEISNDKKIKAEKKLNQKEKLKEKSQQEQENIDKKAKALHHAELANAIPKSSKPNLDKLSEKTIFDKQNLNKAELFANKVNEEKIVTEVLKNKEIEKLAMNSEAKSMPDSNFLGDDEREMRNAVLGNIANVFAQIHKDIVNNSEDIVNNFISDHNINKITKSFEQQRVDKAKQDKIDEMNKEIEVLNKQLSNPNLSESEREVIEDRKENIQDNIKELQEKEPRSMLELQQTIYNAEKDDHVQIIIKNDNPLVDDKEQEIIKFIDEKPDLTKEQLSEGIKIICSEDGKKELSEGDIHDIEAIADGVMEEKEDTKESHVKDMQGRNHGDLGGVSL